MESFDESLLTAYLDDELSEQERKSVDEQLALNPSLMELLDELRQVRSLVSQLANDRVHSDLTGVVLERAKQMATSQPSAGLPSINTTRGNGATASLGRPWWTSNGAKWIAALATAACILIIFVTPKVQQKFVVFRTKVAAPYSSSVTSANVESQSLPAVQDFAARSGQAKETFDAPMPASMEAANAPSDPSVLRSEIAADDSSWSAKKAPGLDGLGGEAPGGAGPAGGGMAGGGMGGEGLSRGGMGGGIASLNQAPTAGQSLGTARKRNESAGKDEAGKNFDSGIEAKAGLAEMPQPPSARSQSRAIAPEQSIVDKSSFMTREATENFGNRSAQVVPKRDLLATPSDNSIESLELNLEKQSTAGRVNFFFSFATEPRGLEFGINQSYSIEETNRRTGLAANYFTEAYTSNSVIEPSMLESLGFSEASPSLPVDFKTQSDSTQPYGLGRIDQDGRQADEKNKSVDAQQVTLIVEATSWTAIRQSMEERGINLQPAVDRLSEIRLRIGNPRPPILENPPQLGTWYVIEIRPPSK